MKKLKKALSIILTFALLLSLLPAAVFAGDSSTENPIEISTAEQLRALALEVNSGQDKSGVYYKLQNDIDLGGIGANGNGVSGKEWLQIGANHQHSFKGSFDGGGYTVSGIYVNTSNSIQGLFGFLGVGGSISNLSIEGVVSGSDNIGSVCGYSYGTIINCHSKVTVTGSGDSVAGVCGTSYGTIKNCSNAGAVTGGGQYVGGVCGLNMGAGSITNCYNTGAVTGSSQHIGGVCGMNNENITNCYNTGNVTGGSNVGGVCGYHNYGIISNSYSTGAVGGSSTVGGACGYVNGSSCTINNCYSLNTEDADRNLDAVGWNNGGTATNCEDKDKVAFAMRNTFTDWDFTNEWIMDAIFQRPILRAIPESGFTGGGSEKEPYLIPDLATLEKMRDYVNSGHSCEGLYFQLTADIDMSGTYSETTGVSWTPIGNDEKFCGTFNGNGKIIQNLYIKNVSNDPVNDSSYHYRGLFGKLGTGGVIKNLSVSGEVYATRWSGGICGEAEDNSSILQCHSAATVSIPDNVGHSESLGGICGSNKGQTVNCYNSGSITGRNNVGGVCGYNNGSGTVKSCYNTGIVNGSSAVGAVCGVVVGTVQNCYYLESSGAASGGESKTASEFASGEVAYLLQNGQTEQIWGQTVGSGYPELTSDTEMRVFQVTFKVDNGEYAVRYGNAEGLLSALLNDPEKSGYTFGGWKNGDTDFSESTVLTRDVTVTAAWTINTYTVTFDCRDGSAVDSQPVNHGEKAVKPSDPTRSGYTFGGWYKNAACTTAWEFETDTVTENTTLYAKWTENSTGGYTPPIIPTSYRIVVADAVNGTVTISHKYAIAGQTVTITVKPNEGYELDALTATDSKGNPVTLTDKGDGTYTFKMPASKVSIDASFKTSDAEPEPDPVKDCAKDGTCPVAKYTDVDLDSWYHDGIHYCVANGLMNGTGAASFDPEGTTSRAMLVMVLYRLEGEPKVGENTFSDVPAGEWYTDTIAWAAENEIVNGVGNNKFAPESSITREQFATILYRYAKYKDYDVTASADITSYVDGRTTADWAKDALSWAVAEKLINGVGNNTLDPTGNATRAQMATILYRFCEKVTQ